MGSSIPMLRLVSFASLFLSLTKAQTAYQSIFTLDAFSVQQTCVQSCFTGGFSNIDCFTDVLGSMIGCPNSPCSKTFEAADACYCRGDLQTVALGWLSSCVDEMCTFGDNSVNIANAASIYTSYCTERGFTALPAQNTAETTSPSGVSASTTANTRSDPTSASSTSSLNTSSPSPASAKNTLTIALAIVSVVAAIAILLAAFSFRKIRRVKMQAKFDALVSPHESASQVNQPVSMAPSYPHYPVPPSAISSNRAGYDRSTIGLGRGYYQH